MFPSSASLRPLEALSAGQHLPAMDTAANRESLLNASEDPEAGGALQATGRHKGVLFKLRLGPQGVTMQQVSPCVHEIKPIKPSRPPFGRPPPAVAAVPLSLPSLDGL